MSKGNTKLIRADKNFENYLKQIAKSRYVNGRDKRELKIPRLTKAITNVPNLRKFLEEARIDEK